MLVSLYDGPASGAGEQLAPAQTVALGGCGGSQSVQFVWRSPPEGPRSGFLTVVATWAGDSLTQRLAYFVPQHIRLRADRVEVGERPCLPRPGTPARPTSRT